MTTFYSGLLALGTGNSSSLVELTNSDYNRQGIAFGSPDAIGNAVSVYQVSWTPTTTWPAVTQLAVCDVSGVVLMVMEFSLPVKLITNKPNTLAAGRVSITVPLPIDTTAALAYDTGRELVGEIAGSATLASVGIGANHVLLEYNSALRHLAGV